MDQDDVSDAGTTVVAGQSEDPSGPSSPQLDVLADASTPVIAGQSEDPFSSSSPEPDVLDDLPQTIGGKSASAPVGASDSRKENNCPCPSNGRNLVVCIDGTANQFGIQVSCGASPLRAPSLIIYETVEHTRRRALQSSGEE